MAVDLTRAIKNVKRTGEIVETLIRYGFEDVVVELGLGGLVDRGRRLFGRPVEAHKASRAERLRRAMEELGPTFMKLGQLLASRPDLIPEEWAQEFRKLQASGPTLPFDEIRKRLEEEFPGGLEEVFRSIDEKPLAAASMAQVHRAVLKDGTRIVLKVLRPGTEELTTADIEVMRSLAQFAENYFANLGYSPTEVVSEFARELKREVDLTYEGRATDRMRRAFEDDPCVRFPLVYWQATTRHVLALEEFRGVLLSRLKEGDLTEQQKQEVVAHGATAVLRQCLEIGFFHADPHPGNLFALIEKHGPESPQAGVPKESVAVGFIDCGMTGQIDEKTQHALSMLVVGVVKGDVEQVIRVVADLADADPNTLEDRRFRSDVHEFISHFEGATLSQINMPALLGEFFQKLRSHSIKCPADLVLLIKALTTIETVGRELDPSFDMVKHATPFVEKVVKRQFGARALKRRMRESLVEYADLLEKLPGEVHTLITQVRRNRLAINLEHRGLARLTQTIEHASRNIAFALIITGMVVGSAILVHASRGGSILGLNGLGVMGFVAAGVLTVLHILTNRAWLKDKRRKR